MVIIKVSNRAHTQELAEKLAKLLSPGAVIVLEGPLGSGKTTFTQGFAKGLGIQRAVKSPTYTIAKEYPLKEDTFFIHIDAYRLEDGGADTVDFAELIQKNNIVVIEWAEFIEDYLPDEFLKLSFIPQENPDVRLIAVEVVGSPESSYHTIVDSWILDRKENTSNGNTG